MDRTLLLSRKGLFVYGISVHRFVEKSANLCVEGDSIGTISGKLTVNNELVSSPLPHNCDIKVPPSARETDIDATNT